MNRLKRELEKHNLFNRPYYDVFNDIECEGTEIKIYSDEFIRVTIYYNVLTIDMLVDTHFNSIEIYNENEGSFNGGLLRDEALAKVKPRRDCEIREYHDGLRVFTTGYYSDELVFAERYTRSFEQIEKERRDLELIRELERQIIGK